MSVALIHPPFTAFPSGGNIYNEQIIQQAYQQGWDMVSIEKTMIKRNEITMLNKNYELLIWDSLFFQDLAEFSSEIPASRSCLLCHYLPSLNPAINQEQQNSWRTLENRCLNAMRFIIVTGGLIKDEIEQRFPDKPVELCTPGIDSVFTQNTETRGKVRAGGATQLLTVANLIPEKGYLEILNTLVYVIHHSWQWHICGSDSADTEYSDLFWQTVSNYDLGSQIHCHGILAQKNMAELMQSCDIFIAASYYESYGMSLAEAAAMRLPIISTEVGAAAKIVKHGINGFLLSVGNRQAMLYYLQNLIENEPLRIQFSSNQRYHYQTWLECYKSFHTACNLALAVTDD